jgi:hypothetical protein
MNATNETDIERLCGEIAQLIKALRAVEEIALDHRERHIAFQLILREIQRVLP